MAMAISYEEDKLADRNGPERGANIAINSCEGGLAIDQGRGPASTLGLPLTSPTPSRVYKCAW